MNKHDELIKELRSTFADYGLTGDMQMQRDAADMLERQALEIATLQAQAASLFDSIKHGDQKHQDWLQEAILCHFEGKPIPREQPYRRMNDE